MGWSNCSCGKTNTFLKYIGIMAWQGGVETYNTTPENLRHSYETLDDDFQYATLLLSQPESKRRETKWADSFFLLQLLTFFFTYFLEVFKSIEYWNQGVDSTSSFLSLLL